MYILCRIGFCSLFQFIFLLGRDICRGRETKPEDITLFTVVEDMFIVTAKRGLCLMNGIKLLVENSERERERERVCVCVGECRRLKNKEKNKSVENCVKIGGFCKYTVIFCKSRLTSYPFLVKILFT